jgi:hypothetical protein
VLRVSRLAGGLSTTPARTLEGGLAGAHFGAAVSTAGDVNGDGFADIVVGAPAWSGNGLIECGKASTYAGSGTGIEASARWSMSGTIDSTHCGAAVANAGDVNGDGYADVLIGFPGADLVFSGTPKGAVSLVSEMGRSSSIRLSAFAGARRASALASRSRPPAT